MRLSAPKGTRDIHGDELRRFRQLEEAARAVFARHGFLEVRPPIFESQEVFSKAVGETTDIVEKEMFAFEDRGGRSLVLRPEGTAGVVRAFLEHGYDQNPQAQKLFYIGPMFRAERPQAGRYREFWQVGAESFGNTSPAADAESLILAHSILKGAGVETGALAFHVNTLGCATCRPNYRAAVAAVLSARRTSLCENCQRRLDKNPLRCLDCKIDGPTFTNMPKGSDFLCEACQSHDRDVHALLADYGVQHADFRVVKDSAIVRGLDYYVRTVFEVKSTALGAQDAVGAGGRYDGLVRQMGGPDTPGVGFALGLDRSAKLIVSLKDPTEQRVFFAFEGVDNEARSAALWARVRVENGQRPWVFDFGSRHQSLKAQLRRAHSWGATHVVLVITENDRPAAFVKFMRETEARQVPVPADPDGFVAQFFNILEESK